MRSWLLVGCLLFVVGSVARAQQSAGDPGKSAAPNAGKQDGSTGAQSDSGSSSTSESSLPRVPNLPPPRSDRVQADELGGDVGESSSKDTQLDLAPPADDAKTHPQSSSAVASAEANALSPDGITEMRTWDPHKAAKDIEVGDFYFKRKNYRAAEERYRDALRYKDNDAMATFRLAVCLEKLGILDDALAEYESYLKILPHGPEASAVQKAIARLTAQTGTKAAQ